MVYKKIQVQDAGVETHMDRWERTQLATSHARETLHKCVVDGARILFTKLIALGQLRVCALNFMFSLLRSEFFYYRNFS